MNKVITIGREHGTGGREIGKHIAEKLGIECYDGRLVSEAARAGGIDEKLTKFYDEKPTSALLYSLSMSMSIPGLTHASPPLPLGEQVFLAQCDVIRKFAQEPCVIVGRCADYILKDEKDLCRVFIRSEIEERVRRIMSTYELTEDKARDMIKKIDKERANYYNFHTDSTWGSTKNYDICLNVTGMDLDAAADIIISYANAMPAKE